MNVTFSNFYRLFVTFSKKHLYNLYFPLLLYFLLRFIYILQIPFFEDEAIFTGWSVEIMKDLHNITLPLTIGIAPLFSWLTFILLFFFKNQLLAGRIISILSGAGILIMLHYVFEKLKVENSLFWLISYTCIPIMFVYNRLAVLDTLLVFFTFGSILLAFRFLKNHNFLTLVIYAIFLFLSILTKQIGLITVPAVLIAGSITFRRIDKYTIWLLITSFIVITLVIILFLPFHNKASSFLSSYVINPMQLNSTLIIIKKNMWLTYHWLNAYYPSLFLLCSFIGLILGITKGNKLEHYFSYIFMIFFISIIITDKLYFPRHTLVLAPLFLLMSAFTIKYLSRLSKHLSFLLICLILINMIMALMKVINRPDNNTVLALEDKFQFYEDWTSGKLLPDIARYLEYQSGQYGHITVWVDSSNMFYSLPLYLKNVDDVSMKWIPENRNQLSQRIQADRGKTYIISNRLDIIDIPFSVIKDFQLSSRHIIKIGQI